MKNYNFVVNVFTLKPHKANLDYFVKFNLEKNFFSFHKKKEENLQLAKSFLAEQHREEQDFFAVRT